MKRTSLEQSRTFPHADLNGLGGFIQGEFGAFLSGIAGYRCPGCTPTNRERVGTGREKALS